MQEVNDGQTGKWIYSSCFRTKIFSIKDHRYTDEFEDEFQELMNGITNDLANEYEKYELLNTSLSTSAYLLPDEYPKIVYSAIINYRYVDYTD
jgi:hypothetical protein